jgi:hypothetical protein
MRHDSNGKQPERPVTRIRARWLKVRIIQRADSGFAREALMAWGEAHAVDYVFGFAKNARLVATVTCTLRGVERSHENAYPKQSFVADEVRDKLAAPASGSTESEAPAVQTEIKGGETRKQMIIHSQGSPIILEFGYERK